MKTATRALCAFTAGAMLAACGTHGASSIVPQPRQSLSPASATSVHMTVVIPAKSKTASGRHTHYISASTQSIGMFVNADDGNPQDVQSGYANVTPGSPGCATDANGNTTCDLSFPALGGTFVTYTVTAYDAPNGTGNKLGAASATATWSNGQDNKFSITLDGVAAKYVVALAKSTVPVGTPTDDAVTVSAYDVDGNLIVNSPNIVDSQGNPLWFTPDLSVSGASSGAISLNNGQWPFTGSSAHYNGGIAGGDVTLTVYSANNVPSNSVTLHFGPPTSASVIYADSLYVGSQSGGTYFGMAYGWPGGWDGPSPLTVDQLSYPDYGMCGSDPNFWAFATDAQNHVAYAATGTCGTDDIVAKTAGASSAAWSISGFNTNGGAGVLPDTIVALGFDATNNVYDYEQRGPVCSTGCTTQIGEIHVLKAGSNGPYSASMNLRTIDCVNSPEAIAVAPDGTVYAAHAGDSHTASDAIEVFAPGASGYFECTGNEATGTPAVTAARYIGGSGTGLDKVAQLALDSAGNLYAANEGANSITVYGPAANGNAAPERTIAGPDTAISSPQGVGVDQFGNLYVLNAGTGGTTGTITVYAAGATGDAKPERTILPGLNQLNGTLALIK